MPEASFSEKLPESLPLLSQKSILRYTVCMVNHVLKQDGRTLSGIFKNAALLKELNELLWQHIDKSLATHCSVANLQNGHLTIIAENGAWATQLRFHIPDLLEKFRHHTLLHSLKSIACKTRPKIETTRTKRKKHIPKPISAKNAQIILQHAEKISDKKLQQILKRIATREKTTT